MGRATGVLCGIAAGLGVSVGAVVAVLSMVGSWGRGNVMEGL